MKLRENRHDIKYQDIPPFIVSIPHSAELSVLRPLAKDLVSESEGENVCM